MCIRDRVTPVTLVQARQGKAHADGVAFRPAGLQLEMDTRYSTKKLSTRLKEPDKSTPPSTLYSRSLHLYPTEHPTLSQTPRRCFTRTFAPHLCMHMYTAHTAHTAALHTPLRFRVVPRLLVKIYTFGTWPAERWPVVARGLVVALSSPPCRRQREASE